MCGQGSAGWDGEWETAKTSTARSRFGVHVEFRSVGRPKVLSRGGRDHDELKMQPIWWRRNGELLEPFPFGAGQRAERAFKTASPEIPPATERGKQCRCA